MFYHADAVELADAGIDSFAHLVRDRVMDDALIASVVKRNVYVMPNLGGAERNRHRTSPAWMDEPYLSGMLKDTVSPPVIARMRASFAAREPQVAERAAQGYAILERSLARLDAAGVRIILGCDTGLPDHFFGYAEQKELELMAAAGMSPMNVIVAATSRAAEYLGVTDTGTLAGASARISSCSMPIRWTISAIPGASPPSMSAAQWSIALRCARSLQKAN